MPSLAGQDLHPCLGAVLYCPVLCCAVLCCVVLCFAALCHAVPCSAVRAVLCCAVTWSSAIYATRSRLDCFHLLLQATLLPSLLSLTNFAKNNSLGSFTSHNLADVSTLSSIPGEELIPGMDPKARGEEGKGTGTELLGTAPGQVLAGPGKGAFGGGADLTEWGQQKNSWDDLNPQETASPSGRRNQEEEKQEDSEQYQGMLWKQLQQQRQQQQKKEDILGKETSQQPPRRANGFHVSGLAKSGGHESAVAHFTQLQRGRTPPGSPYDEPKQAWTRAPSSSPQPEANHARSRPSSGAHRDPRGNRPTSLSHEPDEAQGRAASGSPGRDQGKSKPSTFLSELVQAIEPSVKGKDHR